MSQTNNALTFIRASVDVRQDDGDEWTNVDGHGASVSVSTGDRNTPEQHTFDGDTPIVKGGKRAASSVEVRFVYTEENTDPFEAVRAMWEAEGGNAEVRWIPAGNTAGNYIFTIPSGVMSSFVYPEGNAEGNEIIMGGFTVVGSSIEKSVVEA